MSDSEVTRDDQTLINRFARLNAKHEELECDVKAKRAKLDNAREASQELCLVDDHVLVVAGEVFAKMSTDSAETWVDHVIEDLEKEVKEVEVEMTSLRDQMTTIKTKLYAKFGQNINLESDE